MKLLMDELFETMLLKLIEENYITMESYFLDRTKIEANANKYSFVWKREKTEKEVGKNKMFFSTSFILGTYQTAPFL